MRGWCNDKAHLGLCTLIKHLANNKDGDVVFSEIREHVIGDMGNLPALDFQPGLLQRFSLSTLHEIFAVLEVPTWEGPLSYIGWRVSD